MISTGTPYGERADASVIANGRRFLARLRADFQPAQVVQREENTEPVTDGSELTRLVQARAGSGLAAALDPDA
jgi:hypothetical protein